MVSSEPDRPNFIDRDPEVITSEMIAFYEGQTGKTLHKGQPERLQLNNYAYRETLTRIDIQLAAEQNLVRWATREKLALLGELVDCPPLDPASARCTSQANLTEVQAVDVVIPAGTRVPAKDNSVFATEGDVTVPAGEESAEVTLVAAVAGLAGNGFEAGEISGLLDAVPYVSEIVSTSQSWGGADAEDDEHYRARIMEAPETFAVAGPNDAYKALAKSVHQDIIDVAAVSTYPGVMAIYPLTKSGAPTQEIKDLVLAYLSDKNRRPEGDQVVVFDPTKVEYAIRADVTLYSWAVEATAEAKIDANLTAHAALLRSKLKKDIVESQIKGLISKVYGVYKVVLNSPAEDVVLAANQWADCTLIDVRLVGYVDG